MNTVFAAAYIFAVTFTPGVTGGPYLLTSSAQQAATVSVGDRSPRTFASASQAALAAAVEDANLMPADGEVGVKIYVDVREGAPVYSFGSLIPQQLDPQTSDEEITYDSAATDGHLAVVGVWHRHPFGSTLQTLQGHDEMISGTKQTVWTSIGHALYVQYWEPAMGSSGGRVAEPTLVCADCVP